MSASTQVSLLVTAGDGPSECHQAVGMILDRMTEEAIFYGVALAVHRTPAPHGPKSAVVVVHGEMRHAFAKAWHGTIQWKMKSVMRRHHKRSNWFVGVFALAPAPQSLSVISLNDVVFSTLRAGGPGGQHQNTTDSAVRAVHKPTGLTVVARDARSQHRNKVLALERLQSLADAQMAADQEQRKSSQNQLHHALERGNPLRRFSGTAFKEENKAQ